MTWPERDIIKDPAVLLQRDLAISAAVNHGLESCLTLVSTYLTSAERDAFLDAAPEKTGRVDAVRRKRLIAYGRRFFMSKGDPFGR